MLIATVLASCLMVAVFGVLIYLDLDAIYAAEITDSNPEAAEITNSEEWGEKRQIQELMKEREKAQSQADLIPKREQDVIVYREIVERDANILPNFDDVNRLVTTIGEFERLSGVTLTEVTKLNPSKDAKGKAIRTMPITLKFSGTFDQMLKFINLFENLDRIVNTESFTVTGGREAGDPELGVIHGGTLDLVTYIYTSNAGLASTVPIANYEKRKEDPIIQKSIRQQKPANVDKYQLKHRVGRRDPLVDPRPAETDGPSADQDVDYAEQKRIVDELKFEIELLKEDVRQEQEYKDRKQYVQLYQIQALIDQKVATLAANIEAAAQKVRIAELVEIFRADVLQPFEKIKGDRNFKEVPILVTTTEVQDFADQMAKAYEVKGYEKVVSIWSTFKTRVKNVDVAEDAQPLVDRMEAMQRDAAVLLEFSRIKLLVSGTILIPNAPSKCSVIVNGVMRRIGDYVDQAQQCRLDGIEKEKLIFNFKGERIEFEMTK
jgi:Tfp pilus assembly protein PilO